jgi:putative endonuclease
MNRAEAEQRGRRGETLACWYLRLKGWRILAQRQKVRGGEVDIIARRGRTIAFIEVKWRANAADLDIAIDAPRLRRVVAASRILGPRYARGQDSQQIDVILLAPGHWPRHLSNVWLAG